MTRKLEDTTANVSAPFPAHMPFVAQMVSAYLGANQCPVDRVPELIRVVHAAFTGMGTNGTTHDESKPAVSVKKSLGDDFIICLEDGKKLTMLKRYLRSQYNMSPEEYRKKWGLPHDYPMVAPAYARLRSAFAKKIGLGRVDGKAAKRGRRVRAPVV